MVTESNTIKEVWELGNGIVICKGFHHFTLYKASTKEAIINEFFNPEIMTDII